MTASGFPTLAGVLIPSAGGGSQIVIVGKRNFVRFSYRAEGPVKSMNLASEAVKSVVDANAHAFESRRMAFGRARRIRHAQSRRRDPDLLDAAPALTAAGTCAYNDVVAQEDTPKVAAPASSLRLLRLTRGSLA